MRAVTAGFYRQVARSPGRQVAGSSGAPAGGGILFGFLPAVIGYLVLKDRGPFIRAHTQTALNFQLSLLIYSLAVTIIGVVTFGIGFLLFIPLGIVALVFMIMAAIKANEGQYYSYPLTIKFIS